MATARGVFEEFDPNQGDIDSYINRLCQYFIAWDIEDKEENKAKRKAILLSSIGSKAYKILSDVCYPQQPSEKSFTDLCGILKSHFKPKRLVIAERFRFNSTKQTTGQSITGFAANLKKMAATCDFKGEQLQENLRDRFVCGLMSDRIRTKLLAQNYTFQKALEVALAEEAAEKNVKDMSEESRMVNKVSFRGNRRKVNKSTESERKCGRCGMKNHSSEECRHKTAKCFKCNEIGHLKSQCRNKQGQGRGNDNPRQGNKAPRSKQPVRFVEESANEDDEYETTSEVGDNESDADLDEPIWAIKTGEDAKKKTVDKDNQGFIGTIKIPILMEGSKVEMELDTGAAVSIMTMKDYEKYLRHIPLKKTTRSLRGYTGTPLKTTGEILVDVEYQGQCAALPLVIVEADKYAPPLLGRSWLRAIKLDWQNLFTQVHYSSKLEPVEELKSRYADIFKPELGTIQGTKAILHIKPDVAPIHLKARPVPFSLRPAVEKEIDRMKQEGIIEAVEFSEWATPLVVVPKTDGTVRLCGDYKCTVNQAIHTEQYPIPTPEELQTKMAGGKQFSKIDLKCAYQQMLLDEESQNLVTINTPKGLFRYTRLPYGISSSPAIWQRFIDQVLAGVQYTCGIMDDVLVTGRNDKEHLQTLEEVFKRFQKYGLRVKPEKCEFLKDSVVYMGVKISAAGIQPTEKKVEAVTKAPAPRNVTELRSWLGMLNFHAKFLPNLSSLIHPLNELLGHKEWKWTAECELAFKNVKQELTSRKVLAHYDPKLPLLLATDASPYGLGAVIMHKYDDGSQRPIAYASRTLNKHEKGYSQLDKEALAVIFGVKRFHSYLWGRQFTILTDHKPLERILGPKTAVPTLAAQRLQRWAITLSAFNYDLKFIPSKENATADALSRLPLLTTGSATRENDVYNVESKFLEGLPITSTSIRKATQTDQVLCRVLEYTRSGWPTEVDDMRLKPYVQRKHELSVEQDCLMWGLRVVIPNKHREAMLEELHTAHPGIVRMKEMARSYIWWPKIDEDIEYTVRHCHKCQQTRSVPTVAPLMPWLWPNTPWCRVHIDFAEKDGKNFLVVVDAHSKWPEVIQMKSTTAAATIEVLRDLFSKYGIPVQIVSDNGPQFRSDEFDVFLKKNGVKHIRVAPYHPASNGAAERMVQTFKRSLSAGKSEGQSVQQQLDRFLLSYRTTKHPTTGCTPASLFMGRELRTRLALVRPSPENKVINMQGKQKQSHDKHVKLREFYAGEQVLVKDPRKEETWWSSTIVERTGPKSYVVVLSDGRVWKRHVDHLRRSNLMTDGPEMLPEQSRLELPPRDIETAVASDRPLPETQTREEKDQVAASPPVKPKNTGPTQEQVTVTSTTVPNVPEQVGLRRSTRIKKTPRRLVEGKG